ncbi:hypothetical protein F4802DRAFT_115127 [Xylaria palmicola]|nr:hypothetical protein F4802DRAFT_115127 [Xylaria palmicola]
MIAMTRLPSDSFLPSGGLDHFDRAAPFLSRRRDSVISPLSLPNSIKQPYFDASSRNKAPPNQVSPPSIPIASSPRQYTTRGATGSSVTSPSMAATNSGAMSPFEHLSPQPAAVLLQRREEYIRRLQDNWQAERAHLEASRARAEEMFREERNMMDEERLIWAEQKTKLEKEMADWKQRAETAETESAKLTRLLETTRIGGGKHGDIFHGAAGSVVKYHRSGSSGSPGTAAASINNSRTPSDGVSPSTLPPSKGSTIPESNPFVPLDPRMQSASPTNVPRKGQERIPSIDVYEVIPGLEGIRLKVPAIQKPTFNDTKQSSPTFSPSKESPSSTRKSSAELQSKAQPFTMTQEALLAPEHRRLTMHAGHTPSHSISLSQLPTIDSSAANTAGSSGTTTPTSPGDTKTVQVCEASDQEASVGPADVELREDVALLKETLLNPGTEDPALKGPLCLKNRPAADEVFLRRLSDKLEEVRATDATPSVLSEATIPVPTINFSLSTYDATIENRVENRLEDVEEDVPLKLRKSSNFGQPLGQARRTSGF